MIDRILYNNVKNIATEFPVVALIGPRQSGKTTLAQKAFPHHKYLSLEDLDIREFAHNDPRGFLHAYSGVGVILDEIQHAPDLLSYIQTIVDREKKNGFFVISGSQNFLINQAISQTLAGRIGIVTLLPLSLAELKNANMLPPTIEDVIYKGFFLVFMQSLFRLIVCMQDTYKPMLNEM